MLALAMGGLVMTSHAMAQSKLPVPRNADEGVVIIELIHPERFSIAEIRAHLLEDKKKGERYKTNAKLLERKAEELWRFTSGPDYRLDFGRYEAASEQYLPSGSLNLMRDEATGRIWLVGRLPAGRSVIYGVTVQDLWQVRFDGNTAHFTVPAGGYLYLGRFEGKPNSLRMQEAVDEGEIKISTSTPIGLCNEKIKGYSPPQDVPNGLEAAQSFVDSLNGGQKVTAANIEIGSYVAKITYNFNIVTHTCMATVP